MQKYKPILAEALPLWYAKRISKGWDRTRLEHLFGKENRIYLPLVGHKEPEVKSKVEAQVNAELKKQGYKVHDYMANLAIEDKPVEKIMVNGVEREKKPMIKKIGGLIAGNEPLLKRFNDDPARSASQGSVPIVVLSRHPYDITGMSTDRGWKSCMRTPFKRIHSKGEPLDQGEYAAEYLGSARKYSFVAYLIRPDDKNIKCPMARLLGVPYHRRKDVMYVVPDRPYGFPGKYESAFLKTIQQWLDSKQKDLPDGDYSLNGNVYDDDYEEEITKGRGEDSDRYDDESPVQSGVLKDFLNSAGREDGEEFVDYTIGKDKIVTIKNGTFDFGGNSLNTSTKFIKFGKSVILKDLEDSGQKFEGVTLLNCHILENCTLNDCKIVTTDEAHQPSRLRDCTVIDSEVSGVKLIRDNTVRNSSLKNCIWFLGQRNVYTGTSSWNDGKYWASGFDDDSDDGFKLDTDWGPDTYEGLLEVSKEFVQKTNARMGDEEELFKKWAEEPLSVIHNIIKTKGEELLGDPKENKVLSFLSTMVSDDISRFSLSTELEITKVWESTGGHQQETHLVYKPNPSYKILLSGETTQRGIKKVRASINYKNEYKELWHMEIRYPDSKQVGSLLNSAITSIKSLIKKTK
jgi:hypothetical protein